MLFGIDLGTTNSAISVYVGNEVSKIITLDNGKTTLPSCVVYENGKLIAGEYAYKLRHQSNAIYSAKRYMGTDKVYQLNDGSGNNSVIELRPQDVGAEVIKELVARASYLYPDIKDVTITVPAEFNDLQRKATEEAGRLAGLNVVSIINEPTSAALVYESKVSKNILVYDLGGGTFDVSVIQVSVPEGQAQDDDTNSDGLCFEGLGIDLNDIVDKQSQLRPSYRILASEGNTSLGGDDLDDAVAKLVLSNLDNDLVANGKKVKLRKFISKTAYNKLVSDVESVKKTICSTEGSSAKLYIDGSTVGLDRIEYHIGLEEFAQCTFPIYRKTRLCINSAIAKSGINWTDITDIILVGGSTKSQVIVELLKSDFPNITINNTINPDECVAIGASKQTAITMGESDTTVTDVVPQTISVETICEELDGSYTPGKLEALVLKNTPLPVSVTRTYKLNRAGDYTVVKVYQGTGQFVEEATKLGDLELNSENEEGDSVTVVATINTNGLLEIKVKHKDAFVTKQLSNVFGVSTEQPVKKKSPRDKICDKYERSLKSIYKRVPKKYIEALEKFRETGDKESKELLVNLIDSKSKVLSDFDIMEKTSIFKESDNVEVGEQN